jgi:hypothetical protein
MMARGFLLNRRLDRACHSPIRCLGCFDCHGGDIVACLVFEGSKGESLGAQVILGSQDPEETITAQQEPIAGKQSAGHLVELQRVGADGVGDVDGRMVGGFCGTDCAGIEQLLYQAVIAR